MLFIRTVWELHIILAYCCYHVFMKSVSSNELSNAPFLNGNSVKIVDSSENFQSKDKNEHHCTDRNMIGTSKDAQIDVGLEYACIGEEQSKSKQEDAVSSPREGRGILKTLKKWVKKTTRIKKKKHSSKIDPLRVNVIVGEKVSDTEDQENGEGSSESKLGSLLKKGKNAVKSVGKGIGKLWNKIFG